MKQKHMIVTVKGLAIKAAIDAGLCKEVNDGWDTVEFERFWNKFRAYLIQHRGIDIDNVAPRKYPLTTILVSAATAILTSLSLLWLQL